MAAKAPTEVKKIHAPIQRSPVGERRYSQLFVVGRGKSRATIEITADSLEDLERFGQDYKPLSDRTKRIKELLP